MDNCSFKKSFSNECGGKRYNYKDHSIDEWKEKLWVAEKVYTREDVPTDINICYKHSEAIRGKFRNKLCFNPFKISKHSSIG